jgi:hypothetical protein
LPYAITFRLDSEADLEVWLQILPRFVSGQIFRSLPGQIIRGRRQPIWNISSTIDRVEDVTRVLELIKGRTDVRLDVQWEEPMKPALRLVGQPE